ncbi:MAG: methylenetetrahydrofolate reductase [SAR202 cluster bacterium]|nr:methylenetetrahydrofolate reductase [SAR202 cluster bacterium]
MVASAEGPAAKSGFSARLEQPDLFLTAVEVQPGLAGKGGSLESARRALDLAAVGGVDLICLTDCAGGRPRLRPEAVARHFAGADVNYSITLSCKDVSRNGLETRLLEAADAGCLNLIAVSGDYPAAGFRGGSKPVFDVDSVGLLEMVRDMNARTGANFYPGAVVNPFKWIEGEAVAQYLKLAMKLRAGARFVVSQIGFDARKLDELPRYARIKGIDTPLIASVALLNAKAAAALARGAVPGVTLPAELAASAEREARSRDHGGGWFEELAARQIAVARGLGYRGVYLSGVARPDRLASVLKRAASYSGADWRSFLDLLPTRTRAFYYFELDPATGLNSSDERERPLRKKRSQLAYRLGKAAHRYVFTPNTRGFRLGQRLYSNAGPSRQRTLHAFELAAKSAMYECRDCGDCSLAEIAFLCPESQCPKNQRNGPCGGTKNGMCEVGVRHCIWVRAYYRLKADGNELLMLEREPTVKDGTLQGTSAWRNAFLGRDHTCSVARQTPSGGSLQP